MTILISFISKKFSIRANFACNLFCSHLNSSVCAVIRTLNKFIFLILLWTDTIAVTIWEMGAQLQIQYWNLRWGIEPAAREQSWATFSFLKLKNYIMAQDTHYSWVSSDNHIKAIKKCTYCIDIRYLDKLYVVTSCHWQRHLAMIMGILNYKRCYTIIELHLVGLVHMWQKVNLSQLLLCLDESMSVAHYCGRHKTTCSARNRSTC